MKTFYLEDRCTFYTRIIYQFHFLDKTLLKLEVLIFSGKMKYHLIKHIRQRIKKISKMYNIIHIRGATWGIEIHLKR